MKSLDDIAQGFLTDKSSKHQGYTLVYEKYFSALRDSDVTLLEIGVDQEGSLGMWKEYFSHGKVYGIDIVDKPYRNEVFVGNQADESFLLYKVIPATGDCDIIIDDGSHITRDHIVTFNALWPHVKPGGFYSVEDMYYSRIREFQNPDGFNSLGYFKDMIRFVVDKQMNKDVVKRALKKRKIEVDALVEDVENVGAIHFHPGIVLIEKSLLCGG